MRFKVKSVPSGQGVNKNPDIGDFIIYLLQCTDLMWKDNLRSRRRIRVTKRSFVGDPSLSRAQKIARFAKFGFIAVVILSIVGFVGFQVLALTLPSPENIVRHDGFSTKIVDRNGKLLYDIFVDKRRTQVALSDIPDYLKKATVSVEDKNFYQHSGFDPLGYIRIFYDLVVHRRLIGASTLTQQLVKNVLLNNDRTVIRKVNELVLTLQIERRYSKDQILSLYLNEVPYGGTAYGVESAAETYFGKNVKDLNLVECAILAGLPQLPSRYSPYSSTPTAYVARTTGVLRRMREDGVITADQETQAVAELPNVKFQPKGADFKAPHFVQYVENILNDRYGEKTVETGGLKVATSLDLDLQESAQQIVADEIAKVENVHITNGAAVVVDSNTGEILAMVGSKNFGATDYDGQVNVTTALRQPGSSFKPFTYVTAFKKGYTPATLLADVPTIFPGGIGQPDYTPVSYDGKYRGPVQVRYALGNSLDVPAVKMLALVGIKDVLQTATDMGITSLPPTDETLKRVGLSLTLGGGEVKLLELTSAYGAFMNGGYKVSPIAILRVEDKDGKVLEETKPDHGPSVLNPDFAFQITNILSDNKARQDTFGLNSLLNIPGRQVAVKTGTTNDKRDNWTIGGTPQMTVGVWVGNNDNSAMKQVASGVSGASPIWNKILKAGLSGKPVVNFQQPDDLIAMNVDNISGMKEHDGFPSHQEFFVKGTEPSDDTVHVMLKLCKNEGNLATPSDVAANNFDSKEFVILKENDPFGANGINHWQDGINAWIASQSGTTNLYNPPTQFCSGGSHAQMNIDFVDPRDRTSNLEKTFHVKFNVDSVENISESHLEIDGVTVKQFDKNGPYEYDASLDTGVHKLRAYAKDSKGNETERIITVGVKTNWDAQP